MLATTRLLEEKTPRSPSIRGMWPLFGRGRAGSGKYKIDNYLCFVSRQIRLHIRKLGVAEL